MTLLPAMPYAVPAWTLMRSRDEFGRPDLPLLTVVSALGVAVRDLSEGRAPSEDLSAYRVVAPGDLVVNKLWARFGAYGVSPCAGIISPAYWVLDVDQSRVYPPYLHHLLRSAPYLAEIGRISRNLPPNSYDLSWEQFRAVPVALPDLQEQRRIADFLNDQVALLDRALGLRHQQLTLSAERDVAVMADALSGGRQAVVSTGTAWLPMIPRSWTLAPVRALYEVLLGKMLNPERAGGSHPKPYLRNANVHWFDVSHEDLAVMSFEPGEQARFRVHPGDLLVCEGGAGVAEAGVWRGEVDEVYYQKSLHRVRSTGHLPVEWLMYWLRVAKYAGQFESAGNLATIPHLTGEQLRAYRIPVPPPGQVPLPSLERQVREASDLRHLQRRSAGLLQERKQALVTAAVTGQLDVTTSRRAA